MYEVISYQQRSKWVEKLNQLSKKDIFYHPSYSNLYQSMGDGVPYLFFYEDGRGNKLGYVFQKRKINCLPFFYDENIDDNIYDIITPSYGYGGPLCGIEDKQLIQQYRKEFEEYCQKNNIICEFIRFDPLLQNYKFMDEFMNITYDRETVFIDLTKSEEEIFHYYHKNHKRNIMKASKNGLTFKTFLNTKSLEIVEDFYKLYKETMDKLNASQYSYFSTNYLRKLLSDLTDNSLIGAVFFEDKMIAASVCMFEGDVLHYHLGCSLKEFLNLGGNTYLLHHLALWGKNAGLTKFHLGGGHIARDSLFQFKYRFNPNGTLPFYFGKKIHNPIIYEQLVDKWEKYYFEVANKNFFPAYRIKPRNAVHPLR